MIRKLRIKYTVLALSALFLLLTIIVAGMNLLNYRSVIEEADETLTVLSKNSGVFPSYENGMEWLPSGMSRETPFESRYFSVLLDNENSPILMETSNIYAIDGLTAARYAVEVAKGRLVLSCLWRDILLLLFLCVSSLRDLQGLFRKAMKSRNVSLPMQDMR